MNTNELPDDIDPTGPGTQPVGAAGGESVSRPTPDAKGGSTRHTRPTPAEIMARSIAGPWSPDYAHRMDAARALLALDAAGWRIVHPDDSFPWNPGRSKWCNGFNHGRDAVLDSAYRPVLPGEASEAPEGSEGSVVGEQFELLDTIVSPKRKTGVILALDRTADREQREATISRAASSFPDVKFFGSRFLNQSVAFEWEVDE